MIHLFPQSNRSHLDLDFETNKFAVLLRLPFVADISHNIIPFVCVCVVAWLISFLELKIRLVFDVGKCDSNVPDIADGIHLILGAFVDGTVSFGPRRMVFSYGEISCISD